MGWIPMGKIHLEVQPALQLPLLWMHFGGGGYADEPLKKGSHRVLPGFRRSDFAQARLPSLLSILGEGPDLLTWDGA